MSQFFFLVRWRCSAHDALDVCASVACEYLCLCVCVCVIKMLRAWHKKHVLDVSACGIFFWYLLSYIVCYILHVFLICFKVFNFAHMLVCLYTYAYIAHLLYTSYTYMHSAREHTPLHMRTHRHVPSQANETHTHTHTHTYLGRQAKESRGGGILDDIQVKKKMHVSALVIVCGEYASTVTFQKF